MRISLISLVLIATVALAGCSGSSEPETASAPEGDFCAAAERFADAEIGALESGDAPEDRRAAALASADAYAALAAAAPEEIRDAAERALEGQRGSFDAQDQIGWSEDALADVDDAVTDQLLNDFERFLGEEFFMAEEEVVVFVRSECDPAFLEG